MENRGLRREGTKWTRERAARVLRGRAARAPAESAATQRSMMQRKRGLERKNICVPGEVFINEVAQRKMIWWSRKGSNETVQEFKATFSGLASS